MHFSKFYVLGPNPFNNRLLASHIESFSGEAPQCIMAGEELSCKIYEGGSLFFCDCDKVDVLWCCRLLHRPGCHADQAPGFVLMNVRPECDLLDEIKTFNIYGIFRSTDSFESIEKGIRKVVQEGEHWLSRALLVRSLQSVRNELRQERNGSPSWSALTLREQEILRLIAAGLDNQTLADKLFISPNTVKTHISNIYKKIEVTNRVQAILWFSENSGLLLSPMYAAMGNLPPTEPALAPVGGR